MCLCSISLLVVLFALDVRSDYFFTYFFLSDFAEFQLLEKPLSVHVDNNFQNIAKY